MLVWVIVDHFPCATAVGACHVLSEPQLMSNSCNCLIRRVAYWYHWYHNHALAVVMASSCTTGSLPTDSDSVSDGDASDGDFSIVSFVSVASGAGFSFSFCHDKIHMLNISKHATSAGENIHKRLTSLQLRYEDLTTKPGLTSLMNLYCNQAQLTVQFMPYQW